MQWSHALIDIEKSMCSNRSDLQVRQITPFRGIHPRRKEVFPGTSLLCTARQKESLNGRSRSNLPKCISGRASYLHNCYFRIAVRVISAPPNSKSKSDNKWKEVGCRATQPCLLGQLQREHGRIIFSHAQLGWDPAWAGILNFDTWL